MVARDRSSADDDRTLVRHLHDLAALKSIIIKNKEDFVNCAQQSLEHDREHRGGEVIANMSIPDRLAKACEMLARDEAYQTEYDRFVQLMSYADENERISFDAALVTLKEIIDILA